jgi:hypothetical protein
MGFFIARLIWRHRFVFFRVSREQELFGHIRLSPSASLSWHSSRERDGRGATKKTTTATAAMAAKRALRRPPCLRRARGRRRRRRGNARRPGRVRGGAGPERPGLGRGLGAGIGADAGGPLVGDAEAVTCLLLRLAHKGRDLALAAHPHILARSGRRSVRLRGGAQL